jgi:1,4-alpha-glucan branching enzyme
VMTAPGIPMIFQGQEFLEDGAFSDSEPLDWSRRQRFAGLVNLYADLIRLRRNWYDTTRGLRGQHVHVFHRNGAGKVLAYHRWDAGGTRDDVVVVLNLSAQAFDSYHLGFPRAGVWRVRFNSDWNGYDPSFGNRPSHDTMASPGTADPMPFGASIGLGPYSAVILSQD